LFQSLFQADQASLGRLLSWLLPTPTGEWPFKHFSLRSAHSRIEILSLLQQFPNASSGLAREIVPPRYWFQLDEEGREWARTAANRALLDTDSIEIWEWSWPEDQPLLRSHLIDEPSLQALKDSHFKEFLVRRGQQVRLQVDQFLLHKTAWDRPEPKEGRA